MARSKLPISGLARVVNDRRLDLTQAGITLGTPLYMSPEQVEGKPLDPRTDIYSLGVTAFHMLAGHPPFEGDNAIAIAVQHVKESPPRLRSLRPDIPEALCQIVDRMLAKQPGDRFGSQSELLESLRSIDIDFNEWEQLVEKLSVADQSSGIKPVVLNEDTTREMAHDLGVKPSNQMPTRWWTTPTAWLSAILVIVLGMAAGIITNLGNPPVDPLDVELKLSREFRAWKTSANNSI